MVVNSLIVLVQLISDVQHADHQDMKEMPLSVLACLNHHAQTVLWEKF